MKRAARRTTKQPSRRQPKQQRSRQTVQAVLDAVARVLKREGMHAVTTNRIAAVAGVSIGSVYQYFPDKRAIFIALRERHVAEMGRLVESTLVDHAEATLDDLMRALIDAMVEAHAIDPELHDLLLTQVAHGADADRDFERRLQRALRLALSARAHEFTRPLDYDRILFVLSQIVEALAHGVVLRRPRALSLNAAKAEATSVVLAYLRAQGRSEPPRSGAHDKSA